VVTAIKIMLVGDTHGSIRSIKPKIERAADLGIQKILQVGDFGLWTHAFDGQVFLDEVQRLAAEAQLTVHAIGGNHENWDHWEWAVNNYPTSNGWGMVRSRIALAPRVHHWTWNHKKFVSAGGAVSVDKEWRLQKEAGKFVDITGQRHKATGPRTLYWPNEEFTDNDVHKIRMLGKKADYLITHDCSNNTPWQARLKNDPDSERHRRRIDEVIRLTNPGLHFHGHMHTKYDWINFAGETNGKPIYVQTYGLENDQEFWSYGILDTDTDEFIWRG